MKINIPKKKSNKYIKDYFTKNNLSALFDVKVNQKNILLPDLNDLFFLHQLIILNKRFKILEIGTGWSSLIIAHAHKKNIDKHKDCILKNKLGDLKYIILDNLKKYLKISKKRNKLINNRFIFYKFSKVIMSEFNGRYCTEYIDFPKFNPDFIYLDGPSQYYTLNNKNFSFNTNSKDLMPMVSDLNKIEHFLNPGTVILVDGRSANVNFMRLNFQRNWKYKKINDFHLLILDEKVFGQKNLNTINFYDS